MSALGLVQAFGFTSELGVMQANGVRIFGFPRIFPIRNDWLPLGRDGMMSHGQVPLVFKQGPNPHNGRLAMTMVKILAGGIGLAAIAGGAPAIAQYNPANPAGAQAQLAAQQCSAAVEAQLKTRNYGAVSEAGTAGVLTVTRADAEKGFVRVRGTATSGVPSLVGSVGALSAAQSPPADLTFKCRIDYRGRILELDIDRVK